MSRPVAKPRALGMVLKGYPRVSETFISNEIRLLEEQGYRIHIFSMRPPREQYSNASVKRIRAGVTYLPEYLLAGLPALLWRNILLFPRMPLRYLRGVGLLLSRFRHAPKKHTWLKHFLQAGYLVHLVRTDPETPDITHFHAHFAHTPSSVAMYAALLHGVDFSFTAHAKDIYTQHPAPLARKLTMARFVVTCTRYNQRHLQELAAAAGRPVHVHCVYHGIDLSLFSMNGRPQDGNTAPPYALLTVARFVEKKGLPRVLQALAILNRQGLDFRYTLIGGGEQREQLQGLVQELGLTDRVHLLGSIPQEEVLEHYRRADLFVMGCRIAPDGDRDGIPNVIAESMAMGVPVVATDVSGIPELVEHERTGLLAPTDDPEALPQALALAIRRMLEDQDLRARVIPQAREKVRAVFDNTQLIQDLAAIYRREGLRPDA